MVAALSPREAVARTKKRETRTRNEMEVGFRRQAMDERKRKN